MFCFETRDTSELQCDVQLRGCVLGQMLPENAKTMWLKVENVLHARDVTGLAARR